MHFLLASLAGQVTGKPLEDMVGSLENVRAQFMLDAIQQAIKHHDQYQIEIKLDYELFSARQTRYDIDTYIFLPQNLGISAETYPKTAFYRDIQNYLRLKTPSLNLRELTESDRSPLHTIESIVTSVDWMKDEQGQGKLVTQFKLLSAILKSATRENFLLIEQRVAELAATEHGKAHHIIHSLVEDFLAETERLTERYRALFSHFNLPNVPESVFIAYTFTDESLSILIEENAIEMFQVVDAYLKKSDRREYKQLLSCRVADETSYRKTRGYPSILTIGEDNDTYLYRASVLKSYASSVLFLDVDVQPDGWQWEHIFYALAAGVAMVFATLVTFSFQYYFGTFTLPFFVALVVGYMFKDRIKEIGRILFSKQLEERLHDRRVTIRTRDGKHRLGQMREKMRFIKESEMPASVQRERNRDRISDLSNDGRGENIIHYMREVTLNTEAFGSLFPDFPQITGINNILRLDVRHFLTKMSEPVKLRNYLSKGELIELECHKVYHLHVISRYKSSQPRTGKVRTHQRLVLNQKGIQQIDEV